MSMRPVGPREGDAILGAMRQVALAGGRPLSYADTASILAAAHYLLRRPGLTDIDSLQAVDPAESERGRQGAGHRHACRSNLLIGDAEEHDRCVLVVHRLHGLP